jgi:hypothetical protein
MLASLAIHLIPFAGNDFRPPETILDKIANYELGIGAVLIIAFTLFYGIRFRWWRTGPTPLRPEGDINFAGIAIFSVFLALSALLVYSVLVRLLSPGDYLFRDLFRAIVYLLVPAGGGFLFVALFMSRVQLLRELRVHEHAPSETPVDPLIDREA